MADTFVITGSRPPSARTRSRQSHVSYSRPKSGYRKVAESSDADELLFGSENYSSQSHVRPVDHYQHPTQSSFQHSSQGSSGTLWAQPVPVIKQKKQQPLLWAPSNPASAGSHSSRESNFALKSSHTTLESTKSKYRPMKHTPTYVDETLFGPRLEEPSFDAPWDEKKNKQPFLFSSTDYTKMTYGGQGAEIEPYSVDGRPPSRQGRRPASTRTRPCTVESTGVSSTKTVWKP
ncbi:uncharacterized protein LOC132557570 [Ylistrum balloti]|uniref:uncharacterized protein LOC132557570 n=1 Tax=Ylistrum balloti TaxID=509963 RepID=UPI0029058B7A|nr:uncharacterized protein LOC132557570 [Ylistrum balloti]